MRLACQCRSPSSNTSHSGGDADDEGAVYSGAAGIRNSLDLPRNSAVNLKLLEKTKSVFF